MQRNIGPTARLASRRPLSLPRNKSTGRHDGAALCSSTCVCACIPPLPPSLPPSPPCSVLPPWPAVPISWSSDVAQQQQQRRHQGGPLPGSRVHGGPFPAFLDAAYPMAMGVHQSGSTSLPALGARACHACLSQAKPNAPDNNRHHQNNSERQFQLSPGIPRRGYYLLRHLRQFEHARVNIASTQAI